MICRVWHGWTNHANADAYERLLREEVFRGIANRDIAGYHGIELHRRTAGDEVEFQTVMWFESLDAVQTFAGTAYEKAVVPAAARALLSHFDAQSAHYEVKIPRELPAAQATRSPV
jgi:phage gp37-like protein